MPTVSRSEARQWMSSLQPGEPLFLELQDALVRGVGLRELSNGWKINTTRLCDRLLGGAPSRSDAERAFSETLVHLQSLITVAVVQDRCIAECQQAQRKLQVLIAYTEGEVAKTGQNVTELEKKLVEYDRISTSLSESEQKQRDKLRSLEEEKSRLAGCRAKPAPGAAGLGQQMKNGAIDLLLGPMRAALDALHKQKEGITAIREQTDAKIKQSAQHLTHLKNGLKDLKSLVGKYRILSTDIDLAKLRAELGLLTESKVQSIIHELTGTKKMLLG